MRGASDAFGIVTSFYAQTEAAPATVINWGWTLPDMYADRDQFINTFLHIQDFAQNASVVDRNISFGMYLDGHVFNIAGLYHGDAAYFNDTIIPELLRGLPNPQSNPGAQSVSWLESLTLLNGANVAWPLGRTGYTLHDNFFAKSLTVPEATPFDATTLGAYFDYLKNEGVNPPHPWFSIINLYGGPDSQINNKDTKFAAYKDRDSLWVIQHYGNTNATVPAVNLDFVNGLNSAITNASNVTYGAYINYIDPTLSREEAKDLYYGEELYSKLGVLKTKYDPWNTFWNPLSIEPFQQHTKAAWYGRGHH
jgi:hypothetical protein